MTAPDMSPGLRILSVPAWATPGYSGFLATSKDMQATLISDLELTVGVNGNLSQHISPEIDW